MLRDDEVVDDPNEQASESDTSEPELESSDSDEQINEDSNA